MTWHSLIFFISDIFPLTSRDQHNFNQMTSAQFQTFHTQNHAISPRPFHSDRVGLNAQTGKFVAFLQSWCKLLSGQFLLYLRAVYSAWWAFCLPPLIYSVSTVACIIHGKLFYKRLLNTFCIQQKIKAAVWFMKHRAPLSKQAPICYWKNRLFPFPSLHSLSSQKHIYHYRWWFWISLSYPLMIPPNGFRLGLQTEILNLSFLHLCFKTIPWCDGLINSFLPREGVA